MTRDIIDINDFTILVEAASPDESIVDTCRFEEPLIAVAFYGSGNVDLSVKYGNSQKDFRNTKGFAM